jgi:hypothetical protein
MHTGGNHDHCARTCIKTPAAAEKADGAVEDVEDLVLAVIVQRRAGEGFGDRLQNAVSSGDVAASDATMIASPGIALNGTVSPGTFRRGARPWTLRGAIAAMTDFSWLMGSLLWLQTGVCQEGRSQRRVTGSYQTVGNALRMKRGMAEPGQTHPE